MSGDDVLEDFQLLLTELTIHLPALRNRENDLERLAQFLAQMNVGKTAPNTQALRRLSDLVLIGDFFDPIDEVEDMLEPIMRFMITQADEE